jgi:methionyl-tRNA formyltransferase
MTRLKTIFMGSPEFGLHSLVKIQTHHSVELIAVFSKADAPKGRNQVICETPIKAWATKRHIPTYTPTSKKELCENIHELKPDVILVIAYGMILPKSITDTYLCINVHASLLPKYRGASPIHSSLLNNDKETGVTLIKMNEYMDKGDILFSKKIAIAPSDNLQTLNDKLSALSSKACDEIMNIIKHLRFTPQNHDEASYCRKLHTNDFELQSTDSIEEKIGKIKAFSPRPGAFIIQDGKHIKILDAIIEDETLIPITVKPEGKPSMSYRDYCLSKPALTI